MTTFTAFTTLRDGAAAEALSAAMEHPSPKPTGVGTFKMEDGSGLWEIGGYFLDEPDAASLAVLAAAFDAKDFVVSELPEVDWVSHVQRELVPVEAGRFFVHGSHDTDKVPADKIPLLIDAAMAFGTGHHGTTVGCLMAFENLVEQGHEFRNVADIGCGTAVLAMAAAKVSDATVLASDIDQVAVAVAVANLRANGMAERVKCVEAAGFDHPDIAQQAPFDLIFANILKGPLIDLAPSMHSATSPEGIIILSGILNEQADEVARIYCDIGYNVLKRQEIVEWTTLTLRKNKA